ncbi:hypothetical protein ACJMK2_040538 [Sinanodonta woodiana]|uniref:Protein SCAR n=1 Tax=Sinanodonta woodiana TaxID=1069815 RepID=A0ABD3W4G3_SINWO
MNNRDAEVHEQYNNSSHEIPSYEEPTTDYDKLEFVKAINLSPTHIENENREHTKNIGADELADDGFKICLKMVDSISSSQCVIGERVHFASPIAVHYDYSQSESTTSTQTLDLIDSQSSEQTEVNVCWNEELQHNMADEKSDEKTSVEDLVLENNLPDESVEHSPSNSASSVNDINTFILDQQDNRSLLEVIKSTSFNNDKNTEEINMIPREQDKLSVCEGREVNSEDYQRAAIPATITGSIIESIMEKCFQSAEGRNSNFVLDNFIASTEDGVKRDYEIQSHLKTGLIAESFKFGQKDRYAEFKNDNSSQINVIVQDMECIEVVKLGQRTDNLDNNADVTTTCNQQQIISLEDENSADLDAFKSSQQMFCSDLNNSESANTFNSQQQTISLKNECSSEEIKTTNHQEQNEEDLYLPGVHYGSKTHTLCISVPNKEDPVVCKMTPEKIIQEPQLLCYGTDIDVCEKQNEESKEHQSDDCTEDSQNDSRGNLQIDHSWPSMDATEKCPHTKSFFANKSGNIDNNLDESLEVTDILPGKNLDGKVENHNLSHITNLEEKPKFDGISVNSFREQLKFCIPKHSFPHYDETEITTNVTNDGDFMQSQDPEMLHKSHTPSHLLQTTVNDCDTNTQNVIEKNCKSLIAVAEAEFITETSELSDGSKAVADEDISDIKPGIAKNISLQKQKLDFSYQRSISDHDATVGPQWNTGGFKSNNDHGDDSVVPQIAFHDKRHISQIEDTSDWPEKKLKLENILCPTNVHDQILSTDDQMDENQHELHKCLTNPSDPMPLETYETTLPKFHIAEVSMESSGGELSIQSLIEVPGFISTKDYISSQESMGRSQGFSIHLSQEEQLELSPQNMYLESSEMDEKIKDQAVPFDLDVDDHIHPSDLLDSKTEPVLFYEDHPERAYKSQEGCFKWKYTPSCNLDEVLPSECDSNQQDMMATVKSLVTCARPFRVGLSKRQRVDHLHRSPRK